MGAEPECAAAAAVVRAVFAGGIGFLEGDGRPSGIFKRPVTGRVRIDAAGIAGDEQADRRVHGGPDKAVHHYHAGHYAGLRAAFPHAGPLLVPGSLGENVSTCGPDERAVHVGDVFRLGTATVQVTQPRSPCWKIDRRFDADRMALHVAKGRITGWYYRVLEPGTLEEGDTLVLLERLDDRFSIDRFWAVQSADAPCIDDLAALGAVPGLAEDWRRRLSDRVRWLSSNAGASRRRL
jgi:MOSC domain-containing protein YiiM